MMDDEKNDFATENPTSWALVSPWYFNGNLKDFLKKKDPHIQFVNARLNLVSEGQVTHSGAMIVQPADDRCRHGS
jgi:hypothetical protein